MRFRKCLTLFYCNFNCAFEVCFSIFSSSPRAMRAHTHTDIALGSKSSRAPCHGCSCFQPTLLFRMPPGFILFKTLLLIYLGRLPFVSLEPCDGLFGTLAPPNIKLSRGWHHVPQIHKQSGSRTIKSLSAPIVVSLRVPKFHGTSETSFPSWGSSILLKRTPSLSHTHTANAPEHLSQVTRISSSTCWTLTVIATGNSRSCVG